MLQSLLVCQRCGYSLCRTSSSSKQGRRFYYRCIGKDAFRQLKHAICDSRTIRQDYLDGVVREEVIRLLEDPALLQAEITRRLEAAKQADPTQRRQQHLLREQARLAQSIERLLTAYQDSLLSLDELRRRIEPLRKQHGATQAELEALETASADQQRYLRLVESLAPFQARLRPRAESMDIGERQRIVRLLVKEVIVGSESITIRHCLPIAPTPVTPLASPAPADGPSGGNSLLCTGGPRRQGFASPLPLVAPLTAPGRFGAFS